MVKEIRGGSAQKARPRDPFWDPRALHKDLKQCVEFGNIS